MKRCVLDATVEQAEHGKSVWFTMDRAPRATFETEVEKFIISKVSEAEDHKGNPEDALREAILLGQYSHRGSKPLGEDIAFSQRIVNETDFKMFVDCGVPVGHIGENVFDFRYAFADIINNRKQNKEEEHLKVIGISD